MSAMRTKYPSLAMKRSADTIISSPLPSRTRMRHLSRASQQPTRISSLRNLDQTLARLRRIVPHHSVPQLPSQSPIAGSLESTVDTYQDLEVLLTDTVEFLSRVVNDPVLLAGARMGLMTEVDHASATLSPAAPSSPQSLISEERTLTRHQPTSPSTPTPSKFIVDQQVDNLFTLLKLKKKFVTLRN
uniref:Uncharacterized protein n=1 Tax=Schistocephalus solidus TaxID=70667 RepID=A0A0X3Q429_SCHSO